MRNGIKYSSGQSKNEGHISIGQVGLPVGYYSYVSARS